jgi:hypothetical protein
MKIAIEQKGSATILATDMATGQVGEFTSSIGTTFLVLRTWGGLVSLDGQKFWDNEGLALGPRPTVTLLPAGTVIKITL